MLTLNLLPKQFVEQWQHKPHQLGLNTWNFEIQVGKAATKIFKKSFDLGRMNDKGSAPWKPRTSHRNKTHPILYKDGVLKNSIQWKTYNKKNKTDRGVFIFTHPKEFEKSKQHKGFCYAAVHNAPDYMNTRIGHMRNMPRRQFIGHSSELDKKLNELTTTVLLDKFPK